MGDGRPHREIVFEIGIDNPRITPCEHIRQSRHQAIVSTPYYSHFLQVNEIWRQLGSEEIKR